MEGHVQGGEALQCSGDGEHVRADRKKMDGSAAGVADGVVARVLTTPGLAGEIAAFLLCPVKG